MRVFKKLMAAAIASAMIIATPAMTAFAEGEDEPLLIAPRDYASAVDTAIYTIYADIIASEKSCYLTPARFIDPERIDPDKFSGPIEASSITGEAAEHIKKAELSYTGYDFYVEVEFEESSILNPVEAGSQALVTFENIPLKDGTFKVEETIEFVDSNEKRIVDLAWPDESDYEYTGKVIPTPSPIDHQLDQKFDVAVDYYKDYDPWNYANVTEEGIKEIKEPGAYRIIAESDGADAYLNNTQWILWVNADPAEIDPRIIIGEEAGEVVEGEKFTFEIEAYDKLLGEKIDDPDVFDALNVIYYYSGDYNEKAEYDNIDPEHPEFNNSNAVYEGNGVYSITPDKGSAGSRLSIIVLPGKSNKYFLAQPIDSYLGENGLLIYEASEEPGPDPEPQPQPKTAFRLHHPASGQHHFTTSEKEKDALVANFGWEYEGKGFAVLESGGVPVYRFYNTMNGEHFWTASEKEYKYHVENSKGFINFEEIAWYADPANSSVVRLECGGLHHYTSDSKEIAGLVKLGWKNEGIQF